MLVDRALTVEEIAEYVELYRQGASNAIDAGFDGIEVRLYTTFLYHCFLFSFCIGFLR
jgi:2,4-dienoyl-CoA reductase-like NADH-dependent reductase (Old Yellow Enzyme family)